MSTDEKSKRKNAKRNKMGMHLDGTENTAGKSCTNDGTTICESESTDENVHYVLKIFLLNMS